MGWKTVQEKYGSQAGPRSKFRAYAGLQLELSGPDLYIANLSLCGQVMSGATFGGTVINVVSTYPSDFDGNFAVNGAGWFGKNTNWVGKGTWARDGSTTNCHWGSAITCSYTANQGNYYSSSTALDYTVPVHNGNTRLSYSGTGVNGAVSGTIAQGSTATIRVYKGTPITITCLHNKNESLAQAYGTRFWCFGKSSAAVDRNAIDVAEAWWISKDVSGAGHSQSTQESYTFTPSSLTSAKYLQIGGWSYWEWYGSVFSCGNRRAPVLVIENVDKPTYYNRIQCYPGGQKKTGIVYCYPDGKKHAVKQICIYDAAGKKHVVKGIQ